MRRAGSLWHKRAGTSNTLDQWEPSLDIPRPMRVDQAALQPGSQGSARGHNVGNLAVTGQILTLLVSRDIFAVDKSSRSVAGSLAPVSSSQGNFLWGKLHGRRNSALIKLNKNSVNMELDLRSEVNTIYNSGHLTEVCLLIGWTDDWWNHSGPGLVDLMNNSLHLSQLSFSLLHSEV